MGHCHTRFTPGKRVRVVTHDKRVFQARFVEYRSQFVIFRTETEQRLKIHRSDLKSVTITKEHEP